MDKCMNECMNESVQYIVCIYIGGKKYPLLILYVCPLTKKWSVYHFNGRFIWTVRDRITTKKSRKIAFKKNYKLICILMSQIRIWSLRKIWLNTVLSGKTLVGNHRGQMFLVVGRQGRTHLRRDFVPLLFADPLQVIKVSRLKFGSSNIQLPPQIVCETGSATPGS